ncbi:hypothetical protein BKA63DRAFT_285510 [Paraphoma chrysanthemicola]|nr:hypothetical protein BKA63DRAFT_285510 [Paraphoma chrysanthemicola]
MNDFTSKQPSISERDERKDIANAVSVLNTTQSPFLRLPGELRNKIYTYLCENPSTTQLSGMRNELHYTLQFSTPFRPSVALPHVSRLLHHETSALNFTPTIVRCDTVLALLHLMLFKSAAQRNRVIELQLTAITVQHRIVVDFLALCRRREYVFHELFPRVVRVEFEEAGMMFYGPSTQAAVQVCNRKRLEEWVRKCEGEEMEIEIV